MVWSPACAIGRIPRFTAMYDAGCCGKTGVEISARIKEPSGSGAGDPDFATAQSGLRLLRAARDHPAGGVQDRGAGIREETMSKRQSMTRRAILKRAVGASAFAPAPAVLRPASAATAIKIGIPTV